jgi:hypothetical protein
VLCALIAAFASAAEVVWLEAPSDADRILVAEVAAAQGPALAPVDFLAAATRWSDADDAALNQLDRAVEQARAYETQLDGEILILRDLSGPIAAVTALRDDNGRSRLFAALAYQGFAANRLWGEELATDPDAVPWRIEFAGRTFEKPWVDAVALEPDREATAYDIAEAPQRIAFASARSGLAELLPATLTPKNLPPDLSLVVDGRPSPPTASGNVKVRPGRHLVHLEREGRIVARWDVSVGPGDDVPLSLPVPDAVWQSFAAALADGVPVPAELQPLVAAMGGSVVLARTGDKGPEAFLVDTSSVRVVDLAATAEEESEPAIDILVSAGVLGGWFSSGDFYTQDPNNVPQTKDSVNAVTAGLWLSGDVVAGLLAAGAGLDLLVPIGEHHVAMTGDSSVRSRPIPHIAVGLKQAQLTAGFMFPYHPAVGARLRLPLPIVEARVTGWVGLPGEQTRDDDPLSTYDRLSVYTVTGGIGASF